MTKTGENNFPTLLLPYMVTFHPFLPSKLPLHPFFSPFRFPFFHSLSIIFLIPFNILSPPSPFSPSKILPHIFPPSFLSSYWGPLSALSALFSPLRSFFTTFLLYKVLLNPFFPSKVPLQFPFPFWSPFTPPLHTEINFHKNCLKLWLLHLTGDNRSMSTKEKVRKGTVNTGYWIVFKGQL